MLLFKKKINKYFTLQQIQYLTIKENTTNIFSELQIPYTLTVCVAVPDRYHFLPLIHKPVGCSNNKDILLHIHAVHFSKYLVDHAISCST